MARYVMTAKRKAALRNAQLASARKRRGKNGLEKEKLALAWLLVLEYFQREGGLPRLQAESVSGITFTRGNQYKVTLMRGLNIMVPV